MRSFLALVSFVAFALASCGKPSAPEENPGVAAEEIGQVASCRPTCNTAADCGTAGDPLYDSSHFTCQAGLCQWQGCRSAAECSAESHGGTYVCQPSAYGASPPGGAPNGHLGMTAGTPVCQPACTKASDCVPPGASSPGLEDASHFSCNAGICVWSGCRSTSECVAATHTRKASCEAPPGATEAVCVPTCTAASDCVMPGSGALGDVHHYACRAGRCQWLGCHSNQECRKAMASNKTVCE